MDEPVHEHDCKNCRFLGTDVIRDNNERITNRGVDMYLCPKGDGLGGPLLLRRYGVHGDYSCVSVRHVSPTWEPDERWRVMLALIRERA